MVTEIKENLKMVETAARDFAERHIRPHVMEWDESQYFPVELFKEMGHYGFMGILVPEEYGGAGLGYQEYVSILTEIGAVCGSIGLSVAAHNSLCTNHILEFGNEEQKAKYLPKLATAEYIGAWGLTEPNTGSDAGRMKCTAVKDGDYYIINGTKTFITHGYSGDVVVLMARTGELLDSHGMSAFIIDKGTPGFSAVKMDNKLGMRASETAELIFENCRVHKSQILGEEGDGFIQALKILDGGRISIASLSIGIAKGAFLASKKYAQEREQFGKPISKFQAIAFKLADMAVQLEASELLTRKAAELKDNKQKCTKEGAIAKLYASEAAVTISNEAIQIHGGYGYLKVFPVEKYYRDAKLCTIGEGTSEIQRLVISRQILKE